MMVTDKELRFNGPNPLLLYPVMQGFMKYGSYQDLCAMRQVCQLWNLETQSFFMQKSKININGDKRAVRLLTAPSSIPPSFTYVLTNLRRETLVNILVSLGPCVKWLTIDKCELSSEDLRLLVFNFLPELISLKIRLKIETSIGSSGSSSSARSHYLINERVQYPRVLPMSLGLTHSALHKLRELELIGDFSHRTDIIFDILRRARCLTRIAAKKNASFEDDLFGTWFAEVVLAFQFQFLQCLELDSPLIESQVELLLRQRGALQGLNLNFVAHIPMKKVFLILDKFKRSLQNVEVGLENVPDSLVKDLLYRFKPYNFWIAVHSKFESKLVFPAHSYVMMENRV